MGVGDGGGVGASSINHVVKNSCHLNRDRRKNGEKDFFS